MSADITVNSTAEISLRRMPLHAMRWGNRAVVRQQENPLSRGRTQVGASRSHVRTLVS